MIRIASDKFNVATNALILLLLQISFLPGNRQYHINRGWKRDGIINA
jgi:hypothetical protein